MQVEWPNLTANESFLEIKTQIMLVFYKKAAKRREILIVSIRN